MKRILIRGILVVAVLAFLSVRGDAAVSVSISMFQNDLAPYGSWVDVPSYGTCWHPARVSDDWQPYTVGEWAYTDYGWTWVSHDPWGGVPYHYGTWVWVARVGWVWIPGTVWAPAWVTWCYGDSYVGWAPIPPSINFSYSGYYGSPIVVSQTNYVFVPTNRFVGTEISSARIPRARNAEVFRQSRQRTTNFTVSNGILVNRGPSVQRIEQVAHTRIPRQNVSIARVSPTSISAAGAKKGSRLGVIASAPERARQLYGASKGQAATSAGPAVAPKMRKAAPQERKAAPRERKMTPQEHKAAPQERKMIPQEHKAAPQERKMIPQEHKAAPQERRITPQERKVAPQERKGSSQQKQPKPKKQKEPPPPHR